MSSLDSIAEADFLGIDVAKKKLYCTLLSSNTRKVLWREEVENSQAGIERILDKVPLSTQWVLEPTGRYSVSAARQAKEAGRDVRMAPTREAKAFLNSLSDRAKTDKLDSRGLALFGASRELHPYPLKEPSVEKLGQLLSSRKLLSRTVTKLQLQQSELAEAAPFLAPAIQSCQKQVELLDKEIASLCKTDPQFEAVKRLQSVPGVGPVTSAAVAACLAAKSFAHPDKFVAYCGLDLRVNDSGESRGKRRISKHGDAELRRLLYCAAQSNLRCKSSPFKDQYQREREKGLASTAALVAVSRKLAKVCWSLHKSGQKYTADRVNVQPEHPDRKKLEETTENNAPALDTQP